MKKQHHSLSPKQCIPQSLAHDLQRVMQYGQMGKLDAASSICQKILRKYPKNAQALHFAGLIALQKKKPEKALQYFEHAIAVNSQVPVYYNHAAVAYCDLNNYTKGIEYYQQAVILQPNFAEGHYNLAIALAKVERAAEAETHYLKAIALNPRSPTSYNNLGNVQQQLGKLEEAIASYHQALALNPAYAECYCNLGSALQKQERFAEALQTYRQAITINPNYLEAHHNAGVVCVDLGKATEAIMHFTQALRINPSFILSQIALANVYLRLENYEQAIKLYEQGLALKPENEELLEGLVKAKKASCDWQDLDTWISKLLQAAEKCIETGQPCTPFNFLCLGLTPEKQFKIARNFAQHNFTHLGYLREKLGFSFKPKKKARLKIGYVSADIRNHPTSHLIMNMFSHHNREQFEITVYSIGPRDDSIYRKRIPDLCDHFVDLFDNTFAECAKKIYNDGIDILIDAMGYTQYSRTQIFELRPAPIQICFLAYPGTMGTNFIDYLVTDQYVVPQEQAHCYAEKLLYMPNTYFVTDDQQIINNEISARAMCGLPEEAFVFCCFNRTYKIDPKVFDVWMNILKQVPQSVLWLYSDIPAAEKNLYREAENRGIEPRRIIFAHQIEKSQHLARQQLADLFLDCFTVNAHTTAIDALWAGVPVITYPGDSIISRASGSILSAIGLPELIAPDIESYQALAIHYANNREALYELKQKIAGNKKTEPLFNTALYVKEFEKRLALAWKLYLEGKSQNYLL